MSSLPLISHHLFVAAVKETSRASVVPEGTEEPAPASDVQVREIPMELLDFGRPLPIEAVSPFNIFPLSGST